jgi:anthraniloyl-CoA monooxygenase
MKIACVGGGPGSLYTAILMKQVDPSCEIDVFERNRPDDTFGWGVVFSRETLGHFQDADARSYAAICQSFRYWDNIDTFYQGACVTSTGHGFCGLSRKRLLQILHGRCEELGVRLHFQVEVDPAALPQADLIVACDGVASRVREHFKDAFRPTIELGRCRFTWLGTTWPIDAFTFLYRENEHGLFQVHAYPFEDGHSTFIVECHEDVWRRAGMDRASEEETIAYCERLFAPDLRGHRLLSNRSIWRTFPTIKNERWHHRNIVLMGDAVHTAHFSIGSGTKLAMEDAIALRDALVQVKGRYGSGDIEIMLAAYEEARRVDVLKLQKSAATSQAWFENTARYMGQDPLTFTFNQLTRSMRITWDNLRLRDPAFMDRVQAHFASSAAEAPADRRPRPVPMFTPYALRGLTLRNRVVVSPMCMYSAEDGVVNDWHLVHLGSRAVGGAGLVIAEMTAVSAAGRITPRCAGMYRPEHVAAWRRIVDFVHGQSGAKIALQLGHAGRKGATCVPFEGGSDQPLPTEQAWPLLAASALPYLPESQVPKEMDRRDMDEVIASFVRAARLAEEAGFDMLELHMAHGYLLASFISPLTNRRADAYGGDIFGRMRFPLQVFDAVRAAWPADRPISVRISACDWAEGGLSREDAVALSRALKDHGCDIIDVSTGQTVPQAQPLYGRMYQVPFSDQIRHEAGVPTMTVGALFGGDHCNTVLAAGRADLCVLARAHLRDPYLTLHEAERYGYADQPWPPQYGPAAPR